MLARSATRIVALGLLLTVAAPPARAASPWISRNQSGGIALEYLRPSIETIDARALIGAAFLSAWSPPHRGVAFEFEVPFAWQDYRPRTTTLYGNAIFPSPDGSTIFGYPPTSHTFGNPYLGVRSVPETGPVSFEAGIRLPLAQQNEYVARATAGFADATRWEAFSDHLFCARTAVNLGIAAGSRLRHDVQLGSILSFDTGHSREQDPEVNAVYSWRVGYAGDAVRVGAGIAGRLELSGGVGNLGARSHDQLEFHADGCRGAVHPGLDLHVPLGGWGSQAPLVLGGSITVTP
ncbi:MAG: hypothetical protein ACM3JJ_03270 [Hyphomicrobiales bacterium]